MSCLLASIFTSIKENIRPTCQPAIRRLIYRGGEKKEKRQICLLLPIDQSSRKRKREERLARKQSLPVCRTLNTTSRGGSYIPRPALHCDRATRSPQLNTPASRNMTSLIIRQDRMKPVVTHPRRIQPRTHHRTVRARAPGPPMRASMATRRTGTFRFLKENTSSMTFPPSEAGKTHASHRQKC